MHLSNQYKTITVYNVETTKLCKRGHPLTLDAVYVDKDGKRHCKTCKRANVKQRDLAHRAKINARLTSNTRQIEYGSGNQDRPE